MLMPSSFLTILFPKRPVRNNSLGFFFALILTMLDEITMLLLSSQDVSAIWLSLKVACSATLISTPFGIACGYFLAFGKAG